MPNSREYFNNRIQELTLHFGISERKLAEKCGLSQNTFSRWKKDNGPLPGEKSFNQISKATGCNKEWIANGKGEMFSSYQPPAGNTINFAMGKKSTDLPPKLEQMMTWISEQDDGRDYWAWMEMEFSEKFEGYRKWIKEQQQEKKENTGTDN